MNNYKMGDMFKGWFVGGFEPTAFNTQACEVAVKEYKQHDLEGAHYHKIATEITMVLEGQVKMKGKIWNQGDIVVLQPKEVTSFESITDSKTVVVKVPGVLDDKYVVEE